MAPSLIVALGRVGCDLQSADRDDHGQDGEEEDLEEHLEGGVGGEVAVEVDGYVG